MDKLKKMNKLWKEMEEIQQQMFILRLELIEDDALKREVCRLEERVHKLETRKPPK